MPEKFSESVVGQAIHSNLEAFNHEADERSVMQCVDTLEVWMRDIISINSEIRDILRLSNFVLKDNSISKVEIKKSILLKIATDEYRSRRRRDNIFFAEGILSDPGWDILLDLFISKLNEKEISTTSACIASCVPPTTALRWISVLEKEGLICRSSDKKDRRRQNVHLTMDGLSKMTTYFEEKMIRISR